MSFSIELGFDGPKTNNIENALGTSRRYQFPKIFPHFSTLNQSNLLGKCSYTSHNCPKQRHYAAKNISISLRARISKNASRSTPTTLKVLIQIIIEHDQYEGSSPPIFCFKFCYEDQIRGCLNKNTIPFFEQTEQNLGSQRNRN